MKDVLAKRTAMIDASGIRKVFALAAKLKDPINFSIGLPDLDVPDEIKTAAIICASVSFHMWLLTG